jgi:hypothetical protein
MDMTMKANLLLTLRGVAVQSVKQKGGITNTTSGRIISLTLNRKGRFAVGHSTTFQQDEKEITTMPNKVSTEIAEYSVTTAELAKLKLELSGKKYAVDNAAGMALAKSDRRGLVTLRTDLEKKRIEIKAPALERCKLIDSEANRIKAELLELELPIDAQIKDEESRIAEEKAEKARIAALAQKVLDDKIIEIGKLPLRCLSQDSTEIVIFLATLEAREIGGEFTGDTRTRAEAAKAEAIAEIRIIHAQTVETEERAAVQKAEQEAMAAQRAELSEQKRLNDIEAARLEQLSRAENERIEAGRKIEQEKEAEIKRQQNEIAAKQREEEKQAAIISEQGRIAAEKERKAADRKAKLLASRCKDAETALIKILDICRDETLDGCDALAHIALIAEASI